MYHHFLLSLFLPSCHLPVPPVPACHSTAFSACLSHTCHLMTTSPYFCACHHTCMHMLCSILPVLFCFTCFFFYCDTHCSSTFPTPIPAFSHTIAVPSLPPSSLPLLLPPSAVHFPLYFCPSFSPAASLSSPGRHTHALAFGFGLLHLACCTDRGLVCLGLVLFFRQFHSFQAFAFVTVGILHFCICLHLHLHEFTHFILPCLFTFSFCLCMRWLHLAFYAFWVVCVWQQWFCEKAKWQLFMASQTNIMILSLHKSLSSISSFFFISMHCVSYQLRHACISFSLEKHSGSSIHRLSASCLISWPRILALSATSSSSRMD